MERLVDGMSYPKSANFWFCLALVLLLAYPFPSHAQSYGEITGSASSGFPGGSGFSLSTSSTLPYSPTLAVNNSNSNSALWLLSCPQDPVYSSYPAKFFNQPITSSYQGTFGGDQCSNHPGSGSINLITTAQVSPTYYGGYQFTATIESEYSSSSTTTTTSGPAGISLGSKVTGSSLLSINSLAFTSQVDGFVSDLVSNSINVFSPVPAQNLHALWTWYSEIPYLADKVMSFSPQICSRNSCTPGLKLFQTGLSYQTQIATGGEGYSSTTTCNYPTYNYNAIVTASGFSNAYIPFTQVSQDLQSSSTFSAQLMPYITYAFSIPSLFGQTLQETYDIFTPSKYSAPANQLDALPISVGSEFFVSYKDPKYGLELAMADPSTLSSFGIGSYPKNTITTPFSSSGAYSAQHPISGTPFCSGGTSPDPLYYGSGYTDSLYCRACSSNPAACSGYSYTSYLADCILPTYCTHTVNGACTSTDSLNPSAPGFCTSYGLPQSSKVTIPTPVSIVSLPTDYTYVLAKQADGSYSIYVLRIVPNGRYDVGQPSVPAAPNPTVWNAEWQQYWKQLAEVQNDNVYLQSQFTASGGSFVPINMSVDYAGDIFLTGYTTSSGTPTPAISEIAASGNSQGVSAITSIQTTTLTGQSYDTMMPEIATSPTGQYVFLANQTDGGYVYEYSTPNSQTPSFVPFTQINLAYQKQDPTTGKASVLNVAYWLEHQGLFNQDLGFINGFLSAYSAAQTQQIQSQSLETDSATYHHPISIQDINGNLYILDNWAGALDIAKTDPGCYSCTYSGIFFSALTLRAINSTGQSIPINPTLFNDLFSTKVSTCNPYTISSSGTPSKEISSTSCFSTPQNIQCTPSNPNDKPSQCAQPISTPCTIPGSASPLSGNSYSCTTPSSYTSTYTSLSTPTPYSQNIYPPFGWIISANVIAGTLTNIFGSGLFNVQFNPSQSFSACDISSGSNVCTLNPQNLVSSGYSGKFSPIGPSILALDQQAQGSCFLFIFNCQPSSAIQYPGDIRGAFAPYYYGTGFSVSFNQSLSLLFTRPSVQGYSGIGNIYSYTATNPNSYNALILTSLNTQNYTKLFDGTPQFSCYVSDSGISNSASSCSQLSAVAIMQPPLYNMPDPLKFNEELGGNQQLTFSGAIGSSNPSSPIASSNLNNCIQSISQGVVCNGVSVTGSGTSSSIQNSASASQSQSTITPTISTGVAQQITLAINGIVLVPYAYTTTVDQSWTNFNSGTCTTVTVTTVGRRTITRTSTVTGQTLGAPLISPPTSSTSSRYTFVATPMFSNTIVAPIEGGTIYLQDLLSNYYQQNLSDIGLILPPQIIYTTQSNRQIGDTMVNITTNPLHSGNGAQYILNATHQLNYVVNTYSQGGNPGYQTISSVPTSPPQNGIGAATNVLSNSNPSSSAFVNQNYLGVNVPYSYNIKTPTVATLFNFYVSMANTGLSNLYLSNTLLQGQATSYQVLGYNRLTYLFRDRFNNTFFAPIDADIAEPTQISLKVASNVDQINVNKTSLAISGSATYTVNGATQPLPTGSQIYLYYGQNLNFANYNPLSNPIDAQSCSFTGSPSASQLALSNQPSCILANPLRSNSQAQLASLQTFHTSYNALGDCAPAPSQLISAKTYNCNINSATACPPNAHGDEQFCVPQSLDGSGICTSQVGLIGVAQTDANGAFSLGGNTNPIIVCGIGSGVVNATYYGYPGPEPTTVAQTPLTVASNPLYTCDVGKCTQNTLVNNYYYSPNHQLQTVPIGLFELSYGQIGVTTILLAVCFAVVALLSKSNKAIYSRKRPIKKVE